MVGRRVEPASLSKINVGGREGSFLIGSGDVDEDELMHFG